MLPVEVRYRRSAVDALTMTRSELSWLPSSTVGLDRHVLPRASRLLTLNGWRDVDTVLPGTCLAHPHGQPSTMVRAVPAAPQPMWLLTIGDGQILTVGECTPVDVLVGPAHRAVPQRWCAPVIAQARRAAMPVRLPTTGPLRFGSGDDLPLDPYFLGVLLGDRYLRDHSVTLCNEQAEVHALVRAALPPGSYLRAMKVGAAGTGSCDIVGAGGVNPVLSALRTLSLAGCRAWEKTVPQRYLDGDVATRLALVQGLMDTDGSIDVHGRVEFSSSSLELTVALLELIRGLGGRARFGVKTNVWFTSPRQPTRKAARDAYRLTGIRMPDDITMFRRASKRARQLPGRASHQWTIKAVERSDAEGLVEVHVSAADGRLLHDTDAPPLQSPRARAA
jgi:hypothetical protein